MEGSERNHVDGPDGVEATNCEEHSKFGESSVSEDVEVQSEMSIVEQLESRLAVGKVLKSLEDAYLLYCKYAHAKGFSVKKGDQRYFTHSSEIQAKDYECSCQGVRDERRSCEKISVYQKSTIRTKCKARLRVAREKGGEWKVSRFVVEHNHEMIAPDQTHLLRSSRNVSHAQKSTLEAMYNAGISVVRDVSYMEEEAQRPQNLGFVPKDADDHLNRLKRQTKVEDGDVSELLQYFINKSNNEHFFFWNVQLDDDNKIMNFFFRDYQGMVDYECFGDVLSIDTTYKTNRYNLTCAPFVGINHHKQNVMFGLAFMSEETESSFEWLFTTFLKSMNGKQPETVFTDQCQAMMNAVETVFPRAHHLLCQWHINQKAPSHFGNLNGDTRFKQLWHQCMTYCESEEEFEAVWKTMVEEYSLSGHKWLNDMYKLRHKWATTFSNHKFSGGLLDTSRSESANSVLKKPGDKNISLYDFVLHYEKIQKSWREKEKEEDTRCRHGMPSMILKDNPMLMHVANIYTLHIYGTFQKEFIDSWNIVFIEQPIEPSSDSLLEFKVKSHAQNSKVRKVVFDKQKLEVKCSCHKFETMGVLCKHALKVLNQVNVHFLPETHIKERWMKRIRNRVSDGGSTGVNENESEMVFVNQIMRSTYDLAMRCKSHAETRKMLSENVGTSIEQVNAFFENLSFNDQNASNDFGVDEENGQINEVLICNTPRVKSRGITTAQIQKGESSKTTMESTKRKRQHSHKVTHAPNSQEVTSGQASLHPSASLASQFDANQPHLTCPMSIPTKVNTEFYSGGQMTSNNPFGGPYSSQGHSSNDWTGRH